jgi:hypothetical protein
LFLLAASLFLLHVGDSVLHLLVQFRSVRFPVRFHLALLLRCLALAGDGRLPFACSAASWWRWGGCALFKCADTSLEAFDMGLSEIEKLSLEVDLGLELGDPLVRVGRFRCCSCNWLG